MSSPEQKNRHRARPPDISLSGGVPNTASGSLSVELLTVGKFRAATDSIGGWNMSKVVAAVLLVLIGLALIVGGYTSLGAVYVTGICLIIAGVLMVILALKMAMKCETKTPAK